MLAASLLFVIVVAVLSAITAGQQHAYESHLRIAGTIAAEDLMGRLASLDYAALPGWNGTEQNVGSMTDADGAAMPAMFNMIGRRVSVSTVTETLPNGIKLRGRLVAVAAFDRDNRTVATVQQFVPEPGP
jgi:hypothetical protein